MHQEIHKKSLQFTLIENNSKTQKAITVLMLVSFLVGMVLLIFSIIHTSILFTIVIAGLLLCIVALSYKIIQLRKTRKRIQQKLKTLA